MKINIKELIITILVFIIFLLSDLFGLIPIKLFHLENTKNNYAVVLLFSNLLLLLILFLIYRKDLIKDFKNFTKNFLYNLDIGVKYWIIGLFIMAASNILIIYVLGLKQAQNEQSVQHMINYLPWVMFIIAGIIGPMNEEIVFRKSIRKIINNKYLFIIISGLIFGSLHVITGYQSNIELLYIIPYSSLGMSLAAMYYKTDNIYTSIFIHMLHNTVLTLLSII